MDTNIRQQLSEYIVAHQEDFYRLAYSYVKNRDAALDVVQESIVRALSKSDSLRQPEYMKTWFYRILLNESMNHYRRGKRLVSLEDSNRPRQRPGGAAGPVCRHRPPGPQGAGHHPPALL